MHHLPFEATLTDALFEHLQVCIAQRPPDAPDMLPSISWCWYSGGPRAGTYNWAIHFFSRQYMHHEDIFELDDVSVHIEADHRRRLVGRLLDWKEGIGVFEVESPNV